MKTKVKYFLNGNMVFYQDATFIPRIGEQILHRGSTYTVEAIVYDLSNGIVNISIRRQSSLT